MWTEHLPLPVSEANERAALTDVATRCADALDAFGGSLQSDLQTLAEAERTSREYALAAVRYAERRALQAAARATETRLSTLKGLEYYQERRLTSLGLQPIESDDELEALRAAGRQMQSTDYEW